jgi:MFS family permease
VRVSLTPRVLTSRLRDAPRVHRDFAVASTRSATLAGDMLKSPDNRFIARATLPITLLVQAAASAAIVAPAAAAPNLPLALRIGPIAVGLYIATVYAAAMVSSQTGVAMTRRWGPIRTSQAALVSCALGLLLVGMASPWMAILGAVLLGIGYGPITPASSEMLARTTPLHRYSLVFSIKQTGVPLGGAIAGLIVPPVIGWLGTGWALAQVAVLCAAGIGLAALLRAALDVARDPLAPWPTLRSTITPIRFVWQHPLLRRIALSTLVLSGVQVSLTTYAVSYLRGDLRWTLVAAGLGLTVAQVAGMVGRIGWGLIADRLHDGARRTLRGLTLAMAALGLLLPLLHNGSPTGLVLLLLAAYGATAVGWNGVYLATVARTVPHAEAATATGGSLFFTYFGVVLAPPLFGAAAGFSGSIGIAFALMAVPLSAAVWLLRRR